MLHRDLYKYYIPHPDPRATAKGVQELRSDQWDLRLQTVIKI